MNGSNENIGIDARSLCRGRVLSLAPRGGLIVCDPTGEVIECLPLVTGSAPVTYVSGDEVLLWLDNSQPLRGVIVGRIDPVNPAAVSRTAATGEQRWEPRDVSRETTGFRFSTLVIEADEELVLRVGDSSITIRKDGKILIKGTDLVSHAKRMNRIKGGAVSIN